MMVPVLKIVAILMLLTVSGIHQSQAGTATINFQVRDFWTAEPILGATILLSGIPTLTLTTKEGGNATLNIPFGNYTITVSKAECTQIGPQIFVANENPATYIIAKLQCPPPGSPPLVDPHLHTDRAQYHIGEVITWSITGFAPGAYVQPCLAGLCGPVVQSDASGTLEGTLLVDQLVPTGDQPLTVADITTSASTQIQVSIST